MELHKILRQYEGSKPRFNLMAVHIIVTFYRQYFPIEMFQLEADNYIFEMKNKAGPNQVHALCKLAHL